MGGRGAASRVGRCGRRRGKYRRRRGEGRGRGEFEAAAALPRGEGGEVRSLWGQPPPSPPPPPPIAVVVVGAYTVQPNGIGG